MTTYSRSPYVSFVESRLIPGVVQRAAFHRLTGEIVEGTENIDLTHDSLEVRQLIQKRFLIAAGDDPLAPLLDHYVARPIQNPALVYRNDTGVWMLVRTSMRQTVYSRKRDELPAIIEEKLLPLQADMLRLADGTKTLQQIHDIVRGDANGTGILQDAEFRAALDFLTTQDRQLIKFASRLEDLAEPFTYVNIIPRNLYHSDRKDQPQPGSANETIIDFHLHDIEDASWEFDLIEPTVNHCFRFPHEALGGLDYGSRFCVATLKREVVPLLDQSRRLEVLEVGGGTGTFARSFIKQAASLTALNYHILDLSPALMKGQRTILSELVPESRHFHQDATEFHLPQHTFDLIISNEVIADFPVAPVQRGSEGWEGDGAGYV